MKDRSRPISDNYDEPMPDFTRPPSPATSRRSHPMPDYSGPPSLGSNRQASCYTGESSTGIKAAPLDDVEENVEIENEANENLFSNLEPRMSPRKFSAKSGISAPSNTRANSAANTPPGRSPTAAELRAVSFADIPRSVSYTTRDPPPSFSTRGPSSSDDLRPASRQSDVCSTAGEETEEKSRKRPVGRPTGNVKSRKEGRASEVELPSNTSQRQASAPSASALGKENNGGANDEGSGEGKRKRTAKTTPLRVSSNTRLDNPDSSPTRKVSKLGPEDITCYTEEIEYVATLARFLSHPTHLILEAWSKRGLDSGDFMAQFNILEGQC